MQNQVKTPMEKVQILPPVVIKEHYTEMAKLEKKFFTNYMAKFHGKTPTAWRLKLNGAFPFTKPERMTATEFFMAWNQNVILE